MGYMWLMVRCNRPELRAESDDHGKVAAQSNHIAMITKLAAPGTAAVGRVG